MTAAITGSVPSDVPEPRAGSCEAALSTDFSMMSDGLIFAGENLDEVPSEL
jgi:hypothetical protein